MKNPRNFVIMFVLAFLCYLGGVYSGYEVGSLQGRREGREKGEEVGFERGYNNGVYYMQIDSNWAKKQCTNKSWN
jgi:hypothetical protein